MTAASRSRCGLLHAILFAVVLAAPASAGAGGLSASPEQVELSVPGALSTVEAEVIVRNVGAPVTITREQISDAFRVVRRPSFPLVVPSGGEFVVKIAFRARAEGRLTGRLALFASTAEPALIVPLTASAGPPGLGVVPMADLAFPDVAVGSRSEAIERRIANSGLSRLQVGGIGIEGPGATDFHVTPVGSSGVQLGPDDSQAFEVTFTPSAPGAREAVLVISSNDPTAPTLRIRVSGTGAAADSVPAAAR